MTAQPHPISIRPLLAPADAARFLGISLSTLRRMTAEGRLPAPARIGERRLGYRPADLETYVADRRGAR